MAGGGEESRFGDISLVRDLLGGVERFRGAFLFGDVREGYYDPFNQPVMRSVRQTEEQTCQLARDVKTLVHWLAHDILALAGPVLAERLALFDFIVAELRHREHLDPPRIRPVRTALEKQRGDLLAFAEVLDEKLAGIAQDCDAPLYLVRDVCLLQRKSPSSNAYWQRWNLLHKKLAGKFQRVVDAVIGAMKHIPRASSLVENLNSRLRNYFFPPPSIGHTLSQPVAVLPQSPHLPSQPPSRTSRQKPKRIPAYQPICPPCSRALFLLC